MEWFATLVCWVVGRCRALRVVVWIVFVCWVVGVLNFIMVVVCLDVWDVTPSVIHAV